MKLFTPFTIPKKDNCDLCRIKTSRRTKAENPFLDQLFKTLYRDRFDFVFDWVGLIHFFPHWRITSQEENSNRSNKWEQIFKLLQHCFCQPSSEVSSPCQIFPILPMELKWELEIIRLFDNHPLLKN